MQLGPVGQETGGAVAAAGQDDHGGPRVQQGLDLFPDRQWRGLDPVQILVGQFQNIGLREHAPQPGAIPGDVADKAGSDIGVEHHRPPAPLARQKFCIGIGPRLTGEADPAEKQGGHLGGQGGHVLRCQHAACRVFVVKAVGCVAVHQTHEGKRRGAVGGNDQRSIDMAGSQCFGQLLAEHVARQPGQKPGANTQPAKGNGGVEHGPAGMRHEPLLPARRRGGDHVNQGFATTQDHLRQPYFSGRSAAPTARHFPRAP